MWLTTLLRRLRPLPLFLGAPMSPPLAAYLLLLLLLSLLLLLLLLLP